MLLSKGYCTQRLVKITTFMKRCRYRQANKTSFPFRCSNEMSQEIVKSSCVIRLRIELIRNNFPLIYIVVVSLNSS